MGKGYRIPSRYPCIETITQPSSKPYGVREAIS